MPRAPHAWLALALGALGGCPPPDEPVVLPDAMIGGCPNGDHPQVDYASRDPEECAVIDFACPSEWRFLENVDWPGEPCGCGCVSDTFALENGG